MYPLNKTHSLFTEDGRLSEAGYALVLHLCALNTPESLEALTALHTLTIFLQANFRTHRTLEDVRKCEAEGDPLTNRGPIQKGKLK